ncbi:MAG: RusA family crossover junction endodeoxyribonuclease [Thermoguttaceae bacterium]|nr:RusA family crossover junction endodeoxyribonuclease [Thermoguttaceae bacterium]
MELCLELPWPPTANLIWRTTGRVTYLSKPYKAFLKSAVAAILAQKRWGMITSPVIVDITLHPPRNMRFDVDNRIKPTLDVLTKAGVWQDDSQVVELSVRRANTVRGGLAKVKVKTLNRRGNK